MHKETGVLEAFVADISKAVDTFSARESGSKRALEQLCAADPPTFFAAGIRLAATAKPSDGIHFLVQLLAKDKRLSNWLLDPKACNSKEAALVSRVAADARIPLQSAFEMTLNKALQQQASAPNTDRILRTLLLLETIASQSCWDSFQVELMAYPDKVVRSKAALLIGRSQRNTDWIVRRLLDRDPRVQANAVETLWQLDASEARPHLLNALKSKNNRVFANAALGLYRLGDPSSIRALLEATQHEDPLFRLSALWAIGQTQDPRFLPALTLQFKSAQGKLRLAVAGAMSRIRQREKSGRESKALQIDVSKAAVEADGKRRLIFSLSSQPPKNLSGVKATEFLLWENGTPVEEYDARPRSAAELILAGFVMPWPEAPGELEKGLREGLSQCLGIKRKDDLWRIDRAAGPAPHQTGETTGEAETKPAETKPPENKPSDEPTLPYDDSLISPAIKTAQGYLSDADQLRKIVAQAVPHTRAAADTIGAMQRQSKALGHRSGRRHVFVVVEGRYGVELKEEASLTALRAQTPDHATIFHGFAVDSPGQWALFRELCLSHPEGTFVETDQAGMANALARGYAGVSNQFEISYPLASGDLQAEKVALKLKVVSELGAGQVEVTLEPPKEPTTEVLSEAGQTAA